MIFMKHAEHISESKTELRETLEATHTRLERDFDLFLASAKMCDPERMKLTFDALERELCSHMVMEEELMFPLFGLEADREAAALRAEHNEIRRMLDQIAVDLELHAVDEARIAAFTRLQRAHANREHALLYPWIDTRLPRQSKNRIVDRLRASFRRPPQQEETSPRQ